MTVIELINLLQQEEGHLEVIIPRYSDYAVVEGVTVVDGIDKGYYVMRDHPTANGTVKKYVELI